MIHKIITWMSVLATIAGIIIVIIEKTYGPTKFNFPAKYTYIFIAIGTVVSILLAITDKPQPKDRGSGSVIADKIVGSQSIITNPQNVDKIQIGDPSTSAERRFESGYLLTKEEILSNYTKLSVLIDSIQDNPPENFWDIRKPNESEDTYQERAKNFQNEYQQYIFQLVQKSPIKQDTYTSHRICLSHNAQIANDIQKSYYWLTESYRDLTAYTDGLRHNISLNKRDLETFIKNESLYQEKYINSKILLLQSIDHFVKAYPDEAPTISAICEDLKYDIDFASDNFIHKELKLELGRLFKAKKEILAARLKEPQRQEEIDRIIKDPYLIMLRKTVGFTETLSESEVWSLHNKKIDESITDSSALLSAATLSYMESDGRASIIYLEKALAKNDFSKKMRIFIEKSIERLKSPDIYDGSIGLIILEINSTSVLKKKGLEVGDIIYRINGELLIEPSDISSMLAKTPKEEDVLLEVAQPNGTIKRIALPGSSTTGCKVSQLIMLNAHQL